MKLKDILENHVQLIDPASIAHHNTTLPPSKFPDTQHPHSTVDPLTTLQHHTFSPEIIHSANTYYVKTDDSDKSIDMSIPKEKQTDDENFKLYDFKHDGVLDQQDLFTHLRHLSQKYDVPMSIVKAIINQESQWDPNSIGNNKDSQDIGLMQLNNRYIPEYIKQFWHHDGLKFDPKNPFHNAELGIAYLHSLHKQVGDDKNWEKTVMAYNVGAGAVKSGEIPEAGHKYLASIINMINKKKYGLPKGVEV